jgi:hypothetical protein
MTAEKKFRDSNHSSSVNLLNNSRRLSPSTSLNYSHSSLSSFQSVRTLTTPELRRVPEECRGASEIGRSVDSRIGVSPIYDDIYDSINALTDRLNQLECRISDIERIGMTSPDHERTAQISSIIYRLILFLKSSTCLS